MRDKRIDSWADVLVNYSLGAKKGQYAVIFADPEAMPLVEACVEKLTKAGTIVDTLVSEERLEEILFEHASDEQLKTTSPLMRYAAENCDLLIKIRASKNGCLLSGVPPKKSALRSQGRIPILDAQLGRAAKGELNWVLTEYPTASSAQEARMGTKQFEDFLFSVCKLNEADPVAAWKRIEKQQQVLVDLLNTKKELHFLNAQGTDLKVDISGMTWVNCCGKHNFPDGEVFSGPNLKAKNGGINGVVRYALPTMYRNVEVDGIELIFKNGRVVEANASKGQDFLREMIQQDEGASTVGEIAIGTNYEMQKVTKNILFDEKFGGTFHMALGKGYPETGNTNNSALHWDMIFDMRSGGSITADGTLITKNGKFTLLGW